MFEKVSRHNPCSRKHVKGNYWQKIFKMLKVLHTEYVVIVVVIAVVVVLISSTYFFQQILL